MRRIIVFVGIILFLTASLCLAAQSIVKNLTLLFTYPSLWGDTSFVDLDGDGIKELIGGGFDQNRNMRASLVVYGINQQKLWEYKDFYPEKYLVVDLDGDGKKEVIGSGGDIDEKHTILILDYKGNIKAQWNFDADVYPGFSPELVDDLDNDGKKELIFAAGAVSADRKYAFFILDDKGNIKTNVSLSSAGSYVEHKILVRDIDADGQKEMAIFFGERVARGSSDGRQRDIIIDEGGEVVFRYDFPFYAYHYLNGNLNPITLTKAQEEAFINALVLSVKQSSQLNFSFDKQQYTIKMEQRIVKEYGGKEYPELYKLTMNIYDAESNLVATYQPKLTYSGGTCPSGPGTIVRILSERVKIIDLNNDGNDEIIWLDEFHYREDPTFKVFSLSLKGQ